MEALEVLKEIQNFENMTSEEIQNILKPIIKSYDKDFLSEYLGVSKEHLYRICKKLFIENNERVQFTSFIKLVALEKNPAYIDKPEIRHKKRTLTTPEERKERVKQYQKKYYEEVTKLKRKQQKIQVKK